MVITTRITTRGGKSFSYAGDYVYLYILLEVIRETKLVGVVSMELK